MAPQEWFNPQFGHRAAGVKEREQLVEEVAEVKEIEAGRGAETFEESAVRSLIEYYFSLYFGAALGLHRRLGVISVSSNLMRPTERRATALPGVVRLQPFAVHVLSGHPLFDFGFRKLSDAPRLLL
jgi:hypothetical protein